MKSWRTASWGTGLAMAWRDNRFVMNGESEDRSREAVRSKSRVIRRHRLRDRNLAGCGMPVQVAFRGNHGDVSA